MNLRIVLSDRQAVARGELSNILSGQWASILNGAGAAVFTLDSDDLMNTMQMLTSAPLLTVYSDAGNWGGVVSGSITQSGSRISIRALSNESLLSGRLTARTDNQDDKTNGVIAQALLEAANATWPTLVTVGSFIYSGGLSHWYEIHHDDLLERFQDMVDYDGQDFEVTWDRKLMWYERRGTDKPNVVLAEGRNVIQYPAYTYSEAAIVNDQILMGEGATWATKITARAQDVTSQNVYGLRQDMKVFGDISIQATLDLRAETFLAVKKDPQQLLDLSIVNRPDGLFSAFEIGDRVRVMLPSYKFGQGFDEMVRVIGSEWNTDGVMRVVVEVN